ncbi:MAG: sugar porter family MFS transporter [Armatimonadota bacterium]
MITLDIEEQNAIRRRNRYTLIIAFIAAVGGFLFGYDLSLISSANIFLREQFHLSDKVFGFVTASAALGCIVGPVLGFWLCDAIGREKTMIVASLLLAAGAIATALAQTMDIFVAFRIVGGVGVGLCSIASPMYIAEVAPHRKRGQMGVMYQLAIVVGSTISPLVAFLCVKWFPIEPWRWMFASQMGIILVFVAFLFVLPRSPRWLAQKGRYDEAHAVLVKVDGKEYALKELEEIKKSLAQESGGLAELFKPAMRYALLVGLALAFFNCWTGWSGFSGYIPRLLQMSGLKSSAQAILQLGFTYLFMGALTIVSLWTVDKVGRRPLWLLASILMAFITAATGMVYHFHLSGLIVLLVISLCAIPHGLALGPLPWLMMSEIFPTRIRAKAVAVTTTFLWIQIYITAQTAPIMIGWSEKLIGSPAGLFWVYTAVCLLALVFGWKMLPETKGRTLEEIAQSWKMGRK